MIVLLKANQQQHFRGRMVYAICHEATTAGPVGDGQGKT